ncbi:MAG: VOC family protein [Pseudomonadota bacterium]
MIELALLKVPVSNLDAAVAFYEKALGLTASFVSDEFGWAQMEGLAVPFALYVPGKGGGSGEMGGSLDFHLAAANLEDIKDRLPSEATSIGLFTNADGSVTLEFRDLDGNEIKIFQEA